ncbi:MAG: TonB-dependent siderophore receptor [Pseudolabrys sp.]
MILGTLKPNFYSYMRTILLCSAAVAVWPAQVSAQGSPLEQSAAFSTTKHRFALRAGPLDAALKQWARVAGLKLLVPSNSVAGRQIAGVNGEMTAEAAINQLLADTSLQYKLTGSRSVSVFDRAAMSALAQSMELPAIHVSSGNPNSTMTTPPPYAGGQVATGGQLGMLGNRSFMDTPFNQTSFTQKTIQDQQARKLEDVFINDPSIRANVPRAYGFDFTFIRGFPIASTAYGINGLYGIGSGLSSASLIGIERVETLKGPASLLNGMPPAGGVGGSINTVTKRAGDEPLTQLTTSYNSRSTFGTHVDLGRRFGERNEFGVRVNGAVRGGGTELTDQSQRVTTGTLGLDYRGEIVMLSADVGYEENSIDVMQRFAIMGPALRAVPMPPDASKNYNPTWGFWNSRTKFGIVQGEVDITNNLTAYAQAGMIRSMTNYLYSDTTVTNLNGTYTGSPRRNSQELPQQAVQTGLRSTVDTGPIHHQINFNIAHAENETRIINGTGTAFTSNIYNPVATPAPSIAIGSPPKISSQFLTSIGIADTMSILDNRVQFTVGVRKQYITSGAFAAATGLQTTALDDSALSPGYGLVVKPLSNVSIYANYIEGLEPGSVVASQYANAGQVLPPYHAKQMEAGVKIDWGTFTTTASAFQINRPIQNVDTASNTLTPNGESVNRGIEINTFGAITDNIRLLGGVMFLDARQTKTQGGLNDGKRTFGVSDLQLNMGAEWDTPFIRGLTLTGRMIYTGGFYADAGNTLSVSDWTRFDLGARYTFASPWNGKPVVLRVAVENVLGKNYWQGTQTDRYLYLGAPRTYLVSTTFNF